MIFFITSLFLTNAFIAQAQAQPNPLVISSQPANQVLTLGTQFAIKVSASGGKAPLSYQWYKNGMRLTGERTFIIYRSSAQQSDAGSYQVIVADNENRQVSSSTAVLTIKGQTRTSAPPAIITHPQAISVSEGNYIYLYAKVADVTGVSYQWYKDGAPISGGTQVTSDGSTNFYVWIGSAVPADSGDYRVVFSNTDGSVTSNTARITVAAKFPILLGGCGSCDHAAGIHAFETLLNRKVDYTLVWGWAQTAGDLKYAFRYLHDEFPSGILHYGVPMLIHGHKFADVYNGSDDATYADVARTIASRNPGAYIRMGHEMNGNWYDWSQDGPAGSAAEFVRAYQHLVSVFRSVSPAFKFVWNPGAGKWAGIDFLSTYPGDAYVDVISYDQYEDAGMAIYSPTQRWNHFLENDGRGLNFLAEFSTQHGKPVAFDEWGSAIDDGVYITNMYNWMKAHNTAYQMYWHSNAAFPGGFDTHPVNAQTYKRLFGQ